MSNIKPTFQQLIQALQASWASDTCFSADEWSADNPARGQCVVSSLVVQDYLGGDLRRYRVQLPDGEETHYCNVLPDGTVLDTTASQYTAPITLQVTPVDLKGHTSVREKRLADDETRRRYELLKQRVSATLRPTTVGVGLAVFIWHDGKFLMIRRKGAHGAGTYSVPGGHIEFGESWAETAAREAEEEVGIKIKSIRHLATTNDLMPDETKHYITIWMEADWASGKPRAMEPGKVEQLEWHTFQDLPEPLFQPCWDNLRQVRPELFVRSLGVAD